jgi:hypothetical protein
MRKEMTMKKNLLLTGLLSALLMAMMLFTACSSGSDDPPGLSVPGPGDLPDPPATSGTTTAGVKADAVALLDGLKNNNWQIRYDIEKLVNGKVITEPLPNGAKQTWNVKDDTSLTGLKINAWGNGTETSSMDENTFMPKAGDYMEFSETRDVTVEVTADRSEGSVILYKGSSIAEKHENNGRMTINQNGTVTVSGSQNTSVVYALTVSLGGKDGKIILDAHAERSGTKTMSFSSIEDDIDIPVTYYGSLRVFSIDNTELYEEVIANEGDFLNALEYFGIEVDLDF